MLNYSLFDVDFKQVYVFIKVVELNSFTKAAEILFMTQSAVSKSILRLEKTLNLQLFVRNTKDVQVTPMGKYIYDSWVPPMRLIYESLSEAYKIQQDGYNSITIATVTTTMKPLYFWPLIQQFQKLYPAITVNTFTDTSQAVKNSFFTNNYDIILVPDYERYGYERKKYSWCWAEKKTPVVYCHKDNPLAQISELSSHELTHQKFIILQDEHLPEYTRFFSNFCVRHKLSPSIGICCQDPYSIENQFNENRGIFISHPYFYLAEHPNVRCIPLNEDNSGIVAIWNRENKNPYIQRFKNILESRTKLPAKL